MLYFEHTGGTMSLGSFIMSISFKCVTLENTCKGK